MRAENHAAYYGFEMNGHPHGSGRSTSPHEGRSTPRGRRGNPVGHSSCWSARRRQDNRALPCPFTHVRQAQLEPNKRNPKVAAARLSYGAAIALHKAVYIIPRIRPASRIQRKGTSTMTAAPDHAPAYPAREMNRPQATLCIQFHSQRDWMKVRQRKPRPCRLATADDHHHGSGGQGKSAAAGRKQASDPGRTDSREAVHQQPGEATRTSPAEPGPPNKSLKRTAS